MLYTIDHYMYILYVRILYIIRVDIWYINDTGALRQGSKLLLSPSVWMARGGNR